MKNIQIEQALVKRRDELFDYLSNLTLSEFFYEQYNDIQTGVGIITAGDDYVAELLEASKDTSFDEAFRERVQLVKNLDANSIINSFKNDILELCKYIGKHNHYNKLQAIFIEYDYYESYKADVRGFGKQNYPIILTPRYIYTEIDFSKKCFNIFNAIDFKQAWVDCEDFEWILTYDEVFYELQNLFQFHSAILLFKALESLDKNGALSQFLVRPFTFYINERECEEITLYVLE